MQSLGIHAHNFLFSIPWLYEEEITCFSYRALYLYFLCRTCKEVCMEIYKVISFHHSRVKFLTLQELHATNTRSLIRDMNKICEHLRVIKNKCQGWVELYCNYTVYCIFVFNMGTFVIIILLCYWNYAAHIILSLTSQMGNYPLPTMRNTLTKLTKSHFSWCHTFQHCSDTFLNCTNMLNT